EVDDSWELVSTRMQDRGTEQMLAALEMSQREVSSRATRALSAPANTAAAFAFLRDLALPGAERSTILYRGASERVWSGPFRIEPDDLPDAPYGVLFTDFCVVLYATATGSDGARARAVTLLQAFPPADHLSVSLEKQEARNSGVSGFTFFAPDSLVP